MRLRILFVILVLVLDAVLLTAQQEEVSVTRITVWVKVVDKDGKAIQDLAQQDFEVYEDGRYVEINCFEEMKVADIEAQAQDEEEPPRRYIIYLDLFNTTPREYKSIRPRLEEFLDRAARQKAQVMLAGLLPSKRLGIIAPFTKEISKIKQALRQAPTNATRDRTREYRRYQLTHVLEGATDDPVDAIRDGSRMARRFADEERSESELTLRALESFGAHLAKQELGEHLAVLYVSGGFSSDPGRQYFDIIQGFAEDRLETEEATAFLFERQSNFNFPKELEKSIGKLNRMNVTLSTINTQGMGTPSEYVDGLERLAQKTGGLAISNTQNFELALDKVWDDLKHQYILCYSPPQHRTANEYHKIKVELKKRDARLRHRDGYTD